jgi:hypothetical protein
MIGFGFIWLIIGFSDLLSGNGNEPTGYFKDEKFLD